LVDTRDAFPQTSPVLVPFIPQNQAHVILHEQKQQQKQQQQQNKQQTTKQKKRRAYNTQGSRVVPHLSTN
jgi:hypothetical protein